MADLCSMEDVKRYLSYIAPTGVSANDIELQRLITYATGVLAGLCQLPAREDGEPVIFQSDRYVEHYDGMGTFRLALRRNPISTVQKVSVDGLAIPKSPGAPQPGFQFDRYSVVLRGYRFAKGLQNVVITYVAGYDEGDPVLDELRQAAVELVAFLERTKDFIGIRSKHIGTETVTYASSVYSAALPARVQLLVQRLKPAFAA